MIRLHHCAQTRSMRTLWVLHELAVPFEVVRHPFGKNLRDPDFLALNPAGRVPALELDGAAMFETGAMTELLCERFDPDGLGRRAGHAERAEWLQWVHFAETISQHAAALTQQHVVLYEDSMRSAIVMKLEAARIGKCYEALESVLGTRDYLLEGGFSAADISVGQAVYMARHFKRLEDTPAVAAWYARCTAREGFQKSLPQEDEPRLYAQDFYPAWEG
ncbi:glutathione S-transferase family protein [Nereida sp. MMG025]|uniref:glutathione S-transferase family protein n=1 Tax=Nereida sp. MMG025 TaxID=2909981 RepID=UPI001F3338C5|nr:glutathione S-transferase family protein [Nereida sp. MMG025]MCF6445286.1 glutathione S-transferase family protein [Nereida sp. MMG025]